MTKRKFKKAIKRIRSLPRGVNLLRYAANKAHSKYLHLTKSARVAYPSTIMIEVTNHCNLKCVTCAREYAFGKEMDKGYIDFEKFTKVIDEAFPYLDSVGLTGLGETFLYRDLVKAVDYIRSKSEGIIISVSINAHLPNSIEIAEKLVGKVDTIQISIDGLNETYEAVRLNSNFEKFLASLRAIVELARGTETDIMLNVVVFDKNYQQMADLIQFAHDERVQFINFTPMNVVSITDKDSSYYEFFRTESFQRELQRARDEARKYSDMEFTLPNFSHLTEFVMCRYPWGHFYVSWDGFLPPCCAKPFPKELNFGNVFENGLITSLNSEPYQDFRRKWLQGKSPEFCNNCFNG